MKDHHRRKYCDEHRYGGPKYDASPKGKACANPRCDQYIGADANPNRLYCSTKCKNYVTDRRAYLKRKGRKARAAEMLDVMSADADIQDGKLRSGETVDRIESTGVGEAVLAGDLTQAQGAELISVTEAAFSRAFRAWVWRRKREENRGKWQRSKFMDAMLPADLLHELRELGKTKKGRESERFEDLLDYLVRAHVVFARRWCRLEGERVIYKPFHIKWVRLLLVAFATGGKQMILSPPRHGKSEILIRFVLWLIIMDPNLRIMWVCANTDVAKLMLGAVKDYLQNHEELITAALGPDETFRPPRNMDRPWSSKEIKVKQQSHIGAKSSSLLALGRTSKILSRDVDWLIVDDLEDLDTVREPGQREYSRTKFAEIGSRKMKRTAWIYIGSRNHPDDIPNYLMKSGDKTRWRYVVYSAHDESCGADPNDPDLHTDCMMFPEVNDYEWLMEKQVEMDDLGLPGIFEMRYLNRPIPTEGVVFNMEQIKENALNWSRDLGLEELPAGKLVAGLDPASRGTQAAVLWHYANGMLNLVDIETQEGGGFAGALRIMQEWYDLYGLTDWFYEDNSQQLEFFLDPRLIALKRELGLNVKDHTTGKNKQDPELGISSMAPFYHDGSIDLPYGTTRARTKVNVLLRQLELWTTDGVGRSKGKSDVKMASWFPFPRIVRWMRRDRHQDRIAGHREKGYPKMRSTNTFRRTSYPGRARR